MHIISLHSALSGSVRFGVSNSARTSSFLQFPTNPHQLLPTLTLRSDISYFALIIIIVVITIIIIVVTHIITLPHGASSTKKRIHVFRTQIAVQPRILPSSRRFTRGFLSWCFLLLLVGKRAQLIDVPNDESVCFNGDWLIGSCARALLRWFVVGSVGLLVGGYVNSLA